VMTFKVTLRTHMISNEHFKALLIPYLFVEIIEEISFVMIIKTQVVTKKSEGCF